MGDASHARVLFRNSACRKASANRFIDLANRSENKRPIASSKGALLLRQSIGEVWGIEVQCFSQGCLSKVSMKRFARFWAFQVSDFDKRCELQRKRSVIQLLLSKLVVEDSALPFLGSNMEG